MMTRSIVGRFLILAVLLVSLGVIAQAALIISRGSGKAAAKADVAPAPAPTAAVAALTPAPAVAAPAAAVAPPAAVAGPASPAAQPAPSADAAPIRVVYPGPLGDAPVQPRKFADSAPATPAVPAAQPVPAAAPPAPAAAPPAAAKPAAVVVASAEADTQPTADAAPAGKGGVDINSASVDALNHLGGGHIGQTIVQHRPYRSVEDLVKKRVVRRSVYEQIKNQVAAQ